MTGNNQDAIDRFFNGLNKFATKAREWAEEQEAKAKAEREKVKDPNAPVDSDIFERPARKTSRFVRGEPVWILNDEPPTEEHFVRLISGALWQQNRTPGELPYINAPRTRKATWRELRNEGIGKLYIAHKAEEG